MTKQVRPADVACAICGRDIDKCKVPGLHGMVRERAALGVKQLRAQGHKV